MKHQDNGILESFNKVVGTSKNLSKTKLFVIETANESINKAKLLPNPKPLVGNFWKEGELFILFAFTGTGKTVFAFQIAMAISEGKNILSDNDGNVILENQCKAKKVLYYDAELSLKQFENRYSNEYKNHIDFSENLYRMYINREAVLTDGQSIGDLIIPEIENAIKSHNIEVVIIDNLSTLKEGIEVSKEAKPLMDQLVNIKHKHKVSLMIVGHTPKQHHYKEMVLADLQGSSHLSIQLDTCVAMGNSANDNTTKYLKEVKMRDGKYMFSGDNVISVEIEKSVMVKLKYLKQEDEQNHLRKIDADEVDQKVINCHNDGMKPSEIEQHVPYKKSKIYNVIKDYEAVEIMEKSSIHGNDGNNGSHGKQLKIDKS
tara:strand:- start:1472 stop:2590 length:1119 start_codon:yes stop_codon:yes gene_type:complete